MSIIISTSIFVAALLVTKEALAHSSTSHGLAHGVEHVWLGAVPLALWAVWHVLRKRARRGNPD